MKFQYPHIHQDNSFTTMSSLVLLAIMKRTSIRGSTNTCMVILVHSHVATPVTALARKLPKSTLGHQASIETKETMITSSGRNNSCRICLPSKTVAIQCRMDGINVKCSSACRCDLALCHRKLCNLDQSECHVPCSHVAAHLARSCNLLPQDHAHATQLHRMQGSLLTGPDKRRPPVVHSQARHPSTLALPHLPQRVLHTVSAAMGLHPPSISYVGSKSTSVGSS